MQAADRAKIEVEVLNVEVEAPGKLPNGVFKPHQRQPDILDFFSREGLRFEPADGLPLHQFPDEFDQTEDELHDRALDLFRIRVPPHRPNRLSSSGEPCNASFPCSLLPAALHAVVFFFCEPPIILRICLIRSCGRHGLVMTTSHPALFALSEWPAIAWPVSATTGMCCVRSSAFSRLVASHPSMSGMERSIRIRSGFSFLALSMASTPFCASATRKPQNFRYSPYISRASAKSSTTSTSGSSFFGMLAFFAGLISCAPLA